MNAPTLMEIRIEVNMILAGDIGGTKSLIGMFAPDERRPTPTVIRSFVTSEFANLSDLIAAFTRGGAAGALGASRACFGIAGPVLGERARLTNSPFDIDASAIRRDFGIGHVRLVNDLQAMAYAVPVLEASELHVLHAGVADPAGNVALIAAGTGLGEALLHNVDGRLVPSPTEAGHADWAPRSERDLTILRALIQRFGRAEVESVVSGPGLINLCRVTHTSQCLAVADFNAAGAPAEVTRAAIEKRCAACAEAFEVFVTAYGAEAGNLALRTLATGGVFLGGGIAPKIVPALSDGRFLHAFTDKGTFREVVERIPVSVILNADVGLVGAAIAAGRPNPTAPVVEASTDRPR